MEIALTGTRGRGVNFDFYPRIDADYRGLLLIFLFSLNKSVDHY